MMDREEAERMIVAINSVEEQLKRIAVALEERDGDCGPSGEEVSSVAPGDLERVREYLRERTPEGTMEELTITDAIHGDRGGVKIQAYTKAIDDWDAVKETIKGVEGCSNHNAIEGACWDCGESDGSFWYFYPMTALQYVDAEVNA